MIGLTSAALASMFAFGQMHTEELVEQTYLDKELVAFELDEPGDPASVAAAL